MDIINYYIVFATFSHSCSNRHWLLLLLPLILQSIFRLTSLFFIKKLLYNALNTQYACIFTSIIIFVHYPPKQYGWEQFYVVYRIDERRSKYNWEQKKKRSRTSAQTLIHKHTHNRHSNRQPTAKNSNRNY